MEFYKTVYNDTGTHRHFFLILFILKASGPTYQGEHAVFFWIQLIPLLMISFSSFCCKKNVLLKPKNKLLCIYVAFSSSIYWVVETWVDSKCSLLWTVLPETWWCRCLWLIVLKSGYMNESGISRSYGKSISSCCLRNLHSAFQGGCTNVQGHHGSPFATSPPARGIVWIWAILAGVRWFVVLIYISLMPSDMEYFLKKYLSVGHSFSPFENCVEVLCPFVNWICFLLLRFKNF